jgi:hypothetical protein
MVASNARAMLERENEMLEEFGQTVSSFAGQAVGTEVNLFDAWKQEFVGHQKFNSNLMAKKNDEEFISALNKEIKILEGMRDSITGDSDIDKYWKDHVNDDIKIAKALLSTAA